MNSLYTDKRNFFNVKLNLLCSYNKEIRKQRIQEVQNETPKIKFDYTGFEDFVATFKKKNKKVHKINPRTNLKVKNKWENDANLRTAFLQIQEWKQHYILENIENKNNISKKSGKFVVFL
jgi:hypothetical protein